MSAQHLTTFFGMRGQQHTCAKCCWGGSPPPNPIHTHAHALVCGSHNAHATSHPRHSCLTDCSPDRLFVAQYFCLWDAGQTLTGWQKQFSFLTVNDVRQRFPSLILKASRCGVCLRVCRQCLQVVVGWAAVSQYGSIC